MQAGARWQERYEGGSPEAERLLFEQLARVILVVQEKTRRRSRGGAVLRAFHAKPIIATANARLRFRDDMPESLQVGFARRGAEYPVYVRLSNEHGAAQGDDHEDIRGLAVRVLVNEGEQHDLLCANYPVLHARDARQYVAFAAAMAGNKRDRLVGFTRLAAALGPSEAFRMRRVVRAARSRKVNSLALETYWSRSAIRWGEQAVRYLFRPVEAGSEERGATSNHPDYLRLDLARRLRQAPVSFELCVQPFVDEERTPIEDTSVEWSTAVSAPIPVAALTLPRQDVDSVEAIGKERLLDQLAFNPWHTTDEFRPLGNLNRARKVVYAASAAHRCGERFYSAIPLRNRIAGAAVRTGFSAVNRYVVWHRLPLDFSLLNLGGFRHTLRQKNLIDTEIREAPPAPLAVSPPVSEAVRMSRTYDGSYNDLSDPMMGAVGAAFGRNMKPVYRPDLFNTPNPVVVSDQLLHREAFIPARSLNVLAASWIQFQVHDWVNHARHKLGENDVVVPMPNGRTWRSHADAGPEPVMRFGDNQELVAGRAAQGRPPILFGNQASHWWDGSEVYGTKDEAALLLRERVKQNGSERAGAKLRLDAGYLPEDINGMEVTGFNESWWLGLSAMHTLFAREHNVVCDALRSEYPYLSDERIYQTARLIVSALIAKIHTVEWTPAILATRAIEVGLRANWYGAPRNWLTQLGVWLVDMHAKKGIPQTLPDHHAAPYSLTEEFVSVYRMHPLLPDDYQLFDFADGRLIRNAGFLDIQGRDTDAVMRKTGLTNVLYSLGIAYPGAIVLHNFPHALRQFAREDGEIIDLAVVDLVRNRRRGIPRYNDFRKALHRPPVKRWEELTDNPESVRRMKDIYKEIDLVDTMVGLFAETPPQGFGFSDTAFRIFILMASRRLQSDRFLTVDYRPEIYTPLGLDWIDRNGMTSVILRHCPEVGSVLPRTGSAFAPWRPIGAA